MLKERLRTNRDVLGGRRYLPDISKYIMLFIIKTEIIIKRKYQYSRLSLVRIPGEHRKISPYPKFVLTGVTRTRYSKGFDGDRNTVRINRDCTYENLLYLR